MSDPKDTEKAEAPEDTEASVPPPPPTESTSIPSAPPETTPTSAPESSPMSAPPSAPLTGNTEVVNHPEVSVIISPSPDPTTSQPPSPPPPAAEPPSKPDPPPTTGDAEHNGGLTEVVVTTAPSITVMDTKPEVVQKVAEKPAQKGGSLMPPNDVGPPGTPTKQAESKLVEHNSESPPGESPEPSHSKPNLTRGEERAIEAVNVFKTGLFRRKLVDLKLVSQNTLHEKNGEDAIDGTGDDSQEIDDHDEVLNTRIRFFAGFLLAISLVIMIIVQANTLIRIFSIDTTAEGVESKSNIMRYDATVARIGLQASNPGFPDPRVECDQRNGKLKISSRRCYYPTTFSEAKDFDGIVQFCESKGMSLAYPRSKDEVKEVGDQFSKSSGSFVMGVYGDESGRLLTVDSGREFKSFYSDVSVPDGVWKNAFMCIAKKVSRGSLMGAQSSSSVEKCKENSFSDVMCMIQF